MRWLWLIIALLLVILLVRVAIVALRRGDIMPMIILILGLVLFAIGLKM